MNDTATTELGELVSAEVSENEKEIKMNEYSPDFGKDDESTKELSIKHCKTCGDVCTQRNIDGECLSCSMKRLRHLQTKLVQFKQLKTPEHSFCLVNGHGEVYKNKLHPDWEGKFVINGVELYPAYPLCKECLDILTAYLVYFLEERGIIRKGLGNTSNIFGDPYKIPETITDLQSYSKQLEKFISAATLYALDYPSECNTLYSLLKERRIQLLESESRGIKEWQKERELKLPKNQLELLKLAEKHYPCLQNDTGEQKRKWKEIDWLKRQLVPEPVLQKVAQIVEQAVKMLHLQLDLEEVEQQKWNKQSLTAWLRKEKKVDDLDVMNMWKWIQERTEIALGPFADSAGEVLDQAMEKVTLSNLILESTTGESKPEN